MHLGKSTGIGYLPADSSLVRGRPLRAASRPPGGGAVSPVRMAGGVCPARVVFPRLSGDELGDPRAWREMLAMVQAGAGGFILFGGSLDDVTQGLSRLQAEADFPLLVAADLERGLGQQVKGGTVIPGPMALASACPLEDETGLALFRRVAGIVRDEAAAAGIRLLLAPVADVNTNPANPIVATRSFGEDPAAVARYVEEFILEVQRPSPDDPEKRPLVLACAKHFPGHGGTAVDSHAALPVLSADKARLEGVELLPFLRAKEAGVGAVMAGHIAVPSLDPSGAPASLSAPMLTGLLRGGWGYDGLIVSDALSMKGVSAEGAPPAEVMIRALVAGCDVLLHPDDPLTAVPAWTKAAVEGRVPADEIQKAVARIDRAIASLAPAPAMESIDWAGHDAIARETARRVPCHVHWREEFLPIPEEGLFAVVLDDDSEEERSYPFLRALSRSRRRMRTHVLTRRTAAAEGAGEILKRVADARCLIVAVYASVAAWKGRAGLSPGPKGLLARLAVAAPGVVLTAFGSPYVLKGLGRRADRVLAYDDSLHVQEAAAAALAGEIPFRGRLVATVD